MKTEARIAPASAVHARLRALALRNAQLPPAGEGTMRGALWSAFIAVEFYLLSNPLVYVPTFDVALSNALDLALVVVLLQLPWLRAPRIPWTIAAFLFLAALSSTWSISPADTWSAVRLYLWIAAIAWLIAANVTLRVLVHGLAWGGVVVVVLSLYAHFEHFPGADVPMGGSGYMAGVGTNRNILAYTLVPALSAVVAVAPRSRTGWVLWPFLIGVNGLGIYLAQSGTGYLTAVCVVVCSLVLVALTWMVPRVGRRAVWAMRSLLAAGLIGFLASFDRISSWLGRDSGDLSGRVPLWHAIIDASADARWFGHGWGAVWSHPWQIAAPNDVTDELLAVLQIGYTHGHNSFLDVLPQLGIAGVLLVAVCYLAVLARGMRGALPVGADPQHRSYARFLVVMAFSQVAFGLTEPMAVIPLGWFLLVILATTLPQHAKVRGTRRKSLQEPVRPVPPRPGRRRAERPRHFRR